MSCQTVSQSVSQMKLGTRGQWMFCILSHTSLVLCCVCFILVWLCFILFHTELFIYHDMSRLNHFPCSCFLRDDVFGFSSHTTLLIIPQPPHCICLWDCIASSLLLYPDALRCLRHVTVSLSILPVSSYHVTSASY
ncbi:hypothetical protein VTN00DRAFT_1553 [Thermoascus crustaceus]|uniref:uncharacterized protein n=1 Tax=Thermoascus crustaceus TaxID=5088 RepID=UPI0037448264